MISSAVIVLRDSDKTDEIYRVVESCFNQDILKVLPKYEKNERVYMPLKKDSPEYNYVLNVAKEQKINVYRIYEETVFNREEKKNIEWFLLGIHDPLESEGTFAIDYGTKYEGCCEKCNIGGKVIGDVLVDRKFIRKQPIASLRPDIIVTPEVKWAIETEGLTGVSFVHNVRDYKGREMTDYYSMIIEHVLPPMCEQTWLTYDSPAKKCDKCGIVVPYIRSNLYYNEKDFDNANDFNLTHEFLNNWAERSIIVSKRVKEAFKKYKIRVGFNTMINILDV